MKDDSVVVIENFVKKSDSIYIVGRQFLNDADFFSYPIDSRKIGTHLVSTLSDLRKFSLNDVKKKVIKQKYEANQFVVSSVMVNNSKCFYYFQVTSIKLGTYRSQMKKLTKIFYCFRLM